MNEKMSRKLFSIGRRQKGTILVFVAIALPVLLGVVGLSLDAGRAYALKAQLSAAVDAASLAAARAVGTSNPAALAAAQKYFAANIPAGYFGSTPQIQSIGISTGADGNITVDVRATAPLNTTFLRIIGTDNIGVASVAQTIRRPVDLAFVVDNSTSLRTGPIGDVTADVVQRSKEFVDNFHTGVDRVTLVKYAFGAETPVEFQASRGFNKALIQSEIDRFEFGGAGQLSQYTNSAEGFWHALDQHALAANPASLRVIVFFTDGAPNTFSSTFAFRSNPSRAGSIRSGDDASGTPAGLWHHDAVADTVGSSYGWGNPYGTRLNENLNGIPEFYNPHDINENEFLVRNPAHPRRPVTNYTGTNSTQYYRRINRAARNLVEDMAERARRDGIFVFTLGLGSMLTVPSGPDGERGEDLLMRMANDPAMQNNPALAGDFRPDELQGIYCHAVDQDALGPCFEEILETIIRLSI